MKQKRESEVFEVKASSIKEELGMLREQKIIDEETYRDFFFLASNATTFDQLDQLAHDLGEIWEWRRQAIY